MKIDLYDPAMTTYHQAGIGGLAATIAAWEETGKSIPGLTWAVTEEFVELHWESQQALIQFVQESIRVEDDFVVLRAFETAGDAYSDIVRYAHTSALRMTLLQNNSNVKGGKCLKFKNLGAEYDRVFSCKPLTGFSTRDVLSEIRDWSAFPMKGYLYPGSSISDSDSKCGREPLDRTLANIFAIAGVIPFHIHRNDKAYQAGIAIPQVTDLRVFAQRRHRLLSGIRMWHASSPEDIASRLFPQLFLDDKVDQLSVKLQHCPPIEVLVFGTSPNDKKQKNKTRVVTVGPPTESVLRRIEIVSERFNATPVLDKSVKDREAYASMFRLSEWRRLLTENIVAGRPIFYGIVQALSDVNLRTFDMCLPVNLQRLKRVIQDFRTEKMMSEDNLRFIDLVTMCLYYWRGRVSKGGGDVVAETNLLVHSARNCLTQRRFSAFFLDFVRKSSQWRQPASGYLDCIRWAQGSAWKEAADLFAAVAVSYDRQTARELLIERGFVEPESKPNLPSADDSISNAAE
jgi:hypothetical protein